MIASGADKPTLAVLALFLGLLSVQLKPSLGQAVETRAVSGKQDALVSDGGDSGAGAARAYGQRQLSAHRMMHFGKRLLLAPPPPPGIILPMPRASVQWQDGALSARNDPLQYIFDESLPEEARKFRNNKHLVDAVANLIELTKQQQINECRRVQQQQQQQQQSAADTDNAVAIELERRPLAEAKLMRLIDASGKEPNNDAIFEVERQTKQEEIKRGSDEQIQEEPTGAQEAIIEVANRSPARARNSEVHDQMSRAQISSLLYNLRNSAMPSSLTNLNSYIKKADTPRMAFMHFG